VFRRVANSMARGLNSGANSVTHGLVPLPSLSLLHTHTHTHWTLLTLTHSLSLWTALSFSLSRALSLDPFLDGTRPQLRGQLPHSRADEGSREKECVCERERGVQRECVCVRESDGSGLNSDAKSVTHGLVPLPSLSHTQSLFGPLTHTLSLSPSGPLSLTLSEPPSLTHTNSLSGPLSNKLSGPLSLTHTHTLYGPLFPSHTHTLGPGLGERGGVREGAVGRAA